MVNEGKESQEPGVDGGGRRAEVSKNRMTDDRGRNEEFGFRITDWEQLQLTTNNGQLTRP